MEINNNQLSGCRPLVSVVVITYNSSRYVIETLDSVKAQTYGNLELVISDDGSADDTVNQCQNWINNNQDRFIRSSVIASPYNTGISANANRGIKACSGEWIKLIAGDDALLESCIENNIGFALKHRSEINIIHSNCAFYHASLDESHLMKTSDMKDNLFNNPGITSKGQFKLLLFMTDLVQAPTVVIRKEFYRQMGYFDERMKLTEDYPFWLKATLNGTKIYFLDKVTVKYRKHSDALSNIIESPAVRNQRRIERKIRFEEFIQPNISFVEKILFKTSVAIRLFNKNKRTKFSRFINTIFHKTLGKLISLKVKLSKSCYRADPKA